MSSSDRPSGQQEDRIDIPFLIQYFQTSSDVKLRPFAAGMEPGRSITLIYCEPMTDLKQLSEVVYPRLAELCREQANIGIEAFGANPYLPLNRIEGPDLLHRLTLQVYSGKLVLYFEYKQTGFPCADPAADGLLGYERGAKYQFYHRIGCRLCGWPFHHLCPVAGFCRDC